VRSATVLASESSRICTFRTIFPRIGFTLPAKGGKKLVLGAPLLLSLSPHRRHPTEGHRDLSSSVEEATET